MNRIFREISEDEFTKFTLSSPTKNYMQSLEMFRRYKKTGREAYLLGLVENKKILVAGLTSVIYKKYGKKFFTMSRGPVMDFKLGTDVLTEFLNETKKFLKEKNGIILQISPSLLVPDAPKDFKEKLEKAKFKYLGEYEQVKWIYTINFSEIENLPKVSLAESERSYNVLDNTLDAEAEKILFRTLHKNHRYTVKYATERFDLRLRELDVDEYNMLYDLVKEAGTVHGFVPRDVNFYKELKENFKEKATAVIAELPDGTPIATGFFLLYGDEVIYLSSGMKREYKKLGGPHLIQWAMIKYTYKNGFLKYNFWGTHPDPENGVFKFKQGFNGKVEEFIGTFIAPLDTLGKIYIKKLKPAEQRDLQ